MKVKELLALLSQLPADADVVVRGYEGGVDDAVDVALIPIRRDTHSEWYYGRHEIDKASDIQAVLIAGPKRQSEQRIHRSPIPPPLYNQ